MKQNLLDWLGTFWNVLAAPTPKTFLKEAKKADDKFASAIGWLVVYAIYIIVMTSITTQKIISIPTILTVLFLVPLAVVVFTSSLNFICQRIFQRKAYIYDKLIYITVSILPGFVVFVPVAGLMAPDVFAVLSFLVLCYQVALMVIAVKAIVELELWQALVAVALSIVAGIAICIVIFILIVSTIFPPGLNQA